MSVLRDHLRNPWILAGLLAAGLVAAAVGYVYFAPRGSTMLDEGRDPTATTVKTAAFRGADAAHHVGGTVAIERLADGTHRLRFENYEATNGPDVYLYLSGSPTGTWNEAAQQKVPFPGGADDGEATLRGTFHVPLPSGFDPAAWRSVIVWCDRFSVEFGRGTFGG